MLAPLTAPVLWAVFMRDRLGTLKGRLGPTVTGIAAGLVGITLSHSASAVGRRTEPHSPLGSKLLKASGEAVVIYAVSDSELAEADDAENLSLGLHDRSPDSMAPFLVRASGGYDNLGEGLTAAALMMPPFKGFICMVHE